MIFERIKTPGIAHVSYLIGNKGEAAVVDPRRDIDEYLTLARKHKVTIKYTIETHRQEDFVMGAAELARQCGAKVVNGRHAAFGHGDIGLADGERFELAKGINLWHCTPLATRQRACVTPSIWKMPLTMHGRFLRETLFSSERRVART